MNSTKTSMSFKIPDALKSMEEVNIIVEVIMPVEVFNGAYHFVLPTTFYPNYQQLGAVGVDSHPYAFSYIAQIRSKKRITFISKPIDAACDHSKDYKRVAMFCK